MKQWLRRLFGCRGRRPRNTRVNGGPANGTVDVRAPLLQAEDAVPDDVVP